MQKNGESFLHGEEPGYEASKGLTHYSLTMQYIVAFEISSKVIKFLTKYIGQPLFGQSLIQCPSFAGMGLLKVGLLKLMNEHRLFSPTWIHNKSYNIIQE